jgi:hypothetical protein
MKWVIIILIILTAVVAVALIAVAMKRKKDQVARERASELRSDAAQSASTTKEQEDAAREADRLDPDIDHRSSEYQPNIDGSPTHRADTGTPRTGDAGGQEEDLAAWEREQSRRDQI